jgi:predicted phage-related endonuclease
MAGTLMPAQQIRVASRAHWHALRAHHIGGSDVAILFGESARMTPFELWHIKKGLLPEPDLSDNDAVFWGQCLESAIAAGVAAKTGWLVQKCEHYYSLRPELRLGGTPDFVCYSPDRGYGILEIKNVERFMWARWGHELPLAFQLQPQTYCELTGYRWGAVAALIGGNQLELNLFDARPRTAEIIKKRVAEFWESIEAGIPPAPDYAADAATIDALYGQTYPGKTVDLTGNNRLKELVLEYQGAAEQKRDAERCATAAKAEIHHMLADAELAICGEYRIKAHHVGGVPDVVIDESMVGQTIKGRKGYRGLWISEKAGGDECVAVF